MFHTTRCANNYSIIKLRCICVHGFARVVMLLQWHLPDGHLNVSLSMRRVQAVGGLSKYGQRLKDSFLDHGRDNLVGS